MKDLHAADPVNDVHARSEEVERERAFHRTEIGRRRPLTAIEGGLLMLVAQKEAEIERLREELERAADDAGWDG